MEAALLNKKTKIYSYLDRGSDERQYCHPKIDSQSILLVKKFHEFPEYHTSADNLNLVSKGITRIFYNNKNYNRIL